MSRIVMRIDFQGLVCKLVDEGDPAMSIRHEIAPATWVTPDASDIANGAAAFFAAIRARIDAAERFVTAAPALISPPPVVDPEEEQEAEP